MSQVKIEKLQATILNTEAKLVDLRAQVAKLIEEQLAEAARLNIAVGTEGSFVFGRAATAKELAGKVIAVVELEGGAKLLKVMAGEGIEMKIYDVAPNKFNPASEEAEANVGTPDPIVDAAVSEAPATAVVDLPFDVNAILGGEVATEADSAVAGL